VSVSVERLVLIEKDLNCLVAIFDLINEDMDEFGGSLDFRRDMKELISATVAFSSISAPSWELDTVPQSPSCLAIL
jgi:hypothetical protein